MNYRLYSILFLIIAALGYGGYQFKTAIKPPVVALDNFGQLASFELVDDRGQIFSSKSLGGKVSLIQFFFSNCGSICPKATKEIKTLSDIFSQDDTVRFISISIDPTTDTPELLRTFRQGHAGANPNWTFLTGDTTKIAALLESLKLTAKDLPNGHTTRLVLVDRHGQIRAYYSSLDNDLVEQVKTGIAALR